MDEEESYESPVLLHLERIGEPLPPEIVACTSCPIAMWYWPGIDALVCFCSALHRDTWEAAWNKETELPAKAIKFCDGRQQALARIADAKAQARAQAQAQAQAKQ